MHAKQSFLFIFVYICIMHVLRIILCAAYKRKRFSYASNPLPSLLPPPQTPECNNNYLTHSRSNYKKKKGEDGAGKLKEGI